jgi:hypothetical protein
MRLIVAVSFDPRRGYIASHPELRAPIAALSLSLLRRRVEGELFGGDDVRLVLDKRARQERDARRHVAAKFGDVSHIDGTFVPMLG